MAITKEEFEAYCKTKEGKVNLIEQAKLNGYIPESAIEGLTSNRDELKAEKLATQKKLVKAEKEIEALKTEFGDYKDVRKFKETTEEEMLKVKGIQRDLEARLKVALEEKENIEKKLDTTSKTWYKERKVRDLNRVLSDINVIPSALEYITNSFLDRVEVKIDEETGDISGTSIKDDNGIPQTLDDFFKGWSETKPTLVIDKNASTGGGASGGDTQNNSQGNAQVGAFSDKEFDT